MPAQTIERPRPPEWNCDERSWVIMDCDRMPIRFGKRYDVAATVFITEAAKYMDEQDKRIVTLEG